MNLQRIRKHLKALDDLYRIVGYKAYIRENVIGITIACNLPYKEKEPYKAIFDMGLTDETINYACKYALFLMYCKIHNKDKDHIIGVAKGFLNNVDTNSIKL